MQIANLISCPIKSGTLNFSLETFKFMSEATPVLRLLRLSPSSPSE